jgi:hypothetical protein
MGAERRDKGTRYGCPAKSGIEVILCRVIFNPSPQNRNPISVPFTCTLWNKAVPNGRTTFVFESYFVMTQTCKKNIDIKKDLAKRFCDYRKTYTAAKDQFINISRMPTL